MARVGLAGYEEHLADLCGRMGRHAARPETRQRLPALVAAFAAELPRKNAWTLAEHLAEVDPHGRAFS